MRRSHPYTALVKRSLKASGSDGTDTRLSTRSSSIM